MVATSGIHLASSGILPFRIEVPQTPRNRAAVSGTLRSPLSATSPGLVRRSLEGWRNSIALVPPSEGKSAAGDRTYCAFTTTNIESDHATLRARGVNVDAKIARKGSGRPGLISIEVTIEDPVPPQFFFRDVDGNRFLIVGPT
jgi:hypothetical protein